MVSGTTVSHRHAAGQEHCDALAPAMAAVRHFAETTGIEVALAQRLAIIVEELVCNLIDHATSGDTVAYRLSLDASDDTIAIVLEDDAPPFDPRGVAVPEMPDALRGGGVGLALVCAWAEILSYGSTGGWNRLTLRARPIAAAS